MPGATERQPWYNRLWMNTVNALLPGDPFNTGVSGGAGAAWNAGDYKQFNNDPYARARVIAGMLPGPAGALGELGVNAVQNINGHDNWLSRLFHGGNSGMPQMSNYGPYASGYQGLPNPNQGNPNVLNGDFGINRDGTYTGASIYDRPNDDSGNVPNSPMMRPQYNNGGFMPAWKQSASQGGGLGYGWQSADPGMTMAALGSGFVNVGGGEVADLGQMFLRRAVK